MGYLALNVNVISAEDLKDVNLITKMDVYAVVWISGDPHKQKFKTPVNHEAGPNPTWNFPIKFAVDDSLSHQNRLSIVFKIKSKRVLGDKDIGDVIVPVKELIDGKLPQFHRYPVMTTGKPKGLLCFSYNFGDVVPAAAAEFYEPVTAYPVGRPYPLPPAAGYPYPPSQETLGYAYPPPPQHPGYGAYPAQGGYGYPPKKNKPGMGLGAGLLGGKLGGLLIGDIVSDMAEMDMGGSDF
ncbi:hypothetical protein Q3G72_034610 [Acer saccharum]|nr:hypothetical protein Q3G72_030310 [Acer saccharum]KAK1548875.1 hypothetical protein Q3G72_034610 [Acer saccharum]